MVVVPLDARAGAEGSLGEALTGPAEKAYRLATQLYEAMDYEGALLKFQEAHKESREPRLLWNIHTCETKLKQYAHALRTLEQYQREADALLTKEEKEEAAKQASELSALVSTVRLSGAPAGASVFVDNVLVGETPLTEPLRLDIGERQVRVSKSGFKDQVITESFSGGERTLDVPPLVPVPHEGRLVIDAGGKGTIKVDDRIVGEGRWNGAVPSGPHSVRATAAGMRPYVASVTIEDGQTSTLTVPWTPESGSRLVWWVVGGGLAAAGLAYAGYRVFWPAPTASPEIGTLDPGTIQLPLRSH